MHVCIHACQGMTARSPRALFMNPVQAALMSKHERLCCYFQVSKHEGLDAHAPNALRLDGFTSHLKILFKDVLNVVKQYFISVNNSIFDFNIVYLYSACFAGYQMPIIYVQAKCQINTSYIPEASTTVEGTPLD